MVLQDGFALTNGNRQNFDDWLAFQIHAKLEMMVQPHLDCMLATENASMRAKITELRLELQAMGNLNDNLRQQVTRLQDANDQLRRDNHALQM
jgi:FtsZ-binding cell division protein ZapB